MKKEIVIPDERKSRSPAIIDEDDARILFYISVLEGIHQSVERQSWIYLTKLEEGLNLSRKSILGHLNKLVRYDWIDFERSKKEGEYKTKVIRITKLGLKVTAFLFESNILVEKGDKVYINIPGDKLNL